MKSNLARNVFPMGSVPKEAQNMNKTNKVKVISSLEDVIDHSGTAPTTVVPPGLLVAARLVHPTRLRGR